MRATPKPRWQIDDGIDGIRITIPARRRWLILLFMGVWLLIWANAEGSVIRQLHDDKTREPGFLTFWLAGWTIAGVAVLGSLLWKLAGAVVLEARQGCFRHRYALGPLGFTREYDVYRMHNLRAANEPARSGWMRGGGRQFTGPGVLKFDYGERAVTIRPDLEVTEAGNVANMLSRHIHAGSAPMATAVG